MSASTYFRLLSENDGDPQRALQHAAATIDYLANQCSPGFMRAAPVKPVMAPKHRPEPLDVVRDEPPHG